MEGLDLARSFISRGGQARQTPADLPPHKIRAGKIGYCCYDEYKKYWRYGVSREQPKPPPNGAAEEDETHGKYSNVPPVCDVSRSDLYKLSALPRFKDVEAPNIVRKRNTTGTGVLRVRFSLTLLFKQLASDLFGLLGGHESGGRSTCLAGSNVRHERWTKGREAAFGTSARWRG